MAVLSCTGVYVAGDSGSNECPAGSVRIETEAACRTAVAAAGKTAGSGFVGTDAGCPRGCYYWNIRNYGHFNTHAVGSGRSGYQLLCAECVTRVGCAVLAGGASNNANGLNIDTHTYIRMYI